MNRTMSRTMIVAFTVGLLAAMGGGVPTAWGDETHEARKHFERGKAFFAQKKYREAIESFEAAGRIKPSPILDYNIGRCHAELGNHQEGIAAFKRYLDTAPNAPNRDEVLDRIAELEEALSNKQPDVGAPAASPGDPVPPPASQPGTAGEARPPGEPEEPGARGAEPGGGASSPPGQTEAMPQHEAAIPPGWSPGQEQAAAPPPAPGKDKAPARQPKEEGPLYKQWWFWVGCAGAAVILGFVIGTAVSKDRPASHASSGLSISF